MALSEAGCDVSAICSTYGHPLLKARAVRRTFPYSAYHPLESLTRAIDATEPDIIVPCDDRGVRHLHELYARPTQNGSSGNKLTALIERSLGSPSSYPVVSARYDLLKVAQEEGLRVPRTQLVSTPDDFAGWQTKQPLPWVLKADETWGGRGVRIADTPEQARQHFREVSSPFRLRRAVKRMIVNRDPFWLRPWWEGRRPAVVVQGYVQGRPANCAVMCWEGKVLAGIGVEVVSAEGLTGPASVVRVVHNSEMLIFADRIARRLRLSGFFGFDFMIEEGTNDTYLIEMNPRCTPLCHLRLGKGRDMVAGLWAQLAGQPLSDTQPITENDMIAYFPQAWNAKSEFLDSSFHDIPQGEPELLEELLRPWPERSLLFRLTNHVQQVKEYAAAAFAGKSSDYSGT